MNTFTSSKSFQKLASLFYKSTFNINIERTTQTRKNKVFHKNSFYVGRALKTRFNENSNGNGMQEVYQSVSQELSLVPIYIEKLRKSFDERTFSMALNMLYHNVSRSSLHQANASAVATQTQEYLDQLSKVLFDNLSSITKPHTVFTTARKFSHMGIKIPEEYREKVGLQAVKSVDPATYQFLDSGSALGLLIKFLVRTEVTSADVYKRLNEIVLENTRKMQYFYIIVSFVKLSEIKNVMTPENIGRYLEIFQERKQLISLDHFAKIAQAVGNQIKIGEGVIREHPEVVGKIFKLLKELADEIAKKGASVQPTQYLQYIYAILKIKEIRAFLDLDEKFSKEISELDKSLKEIWEKLPETSKPLIPGVINHIAHTIELLELLEVFPEDLECLKGKSKKLLIESLILTFDIRITELMQERHLNLILSFLASQESFIKEEKIALEVRQLVMEKVKSVGAVKDNHSEILKKFKLLKGNEETLRSFQQQKYYNDPLLYTENEKDFDNDKE